MKLPRIDITRHYYYVKPLVPRRLQLLVRSLVAMRKRELCKNIWPILKEAGNLPEEWRGWPDKKQFAVVLTHDVDTFKGYERCRQLLQLEDGQGFRSSFNLVAAGYRISKELRHHIQDRGYEVGVHGLFHDRRIYDSREGFRSQAVHINRFLLEWQAAGFRSPCMYHNLDWLQDLDIEYDASTFDTDPFEPQPDGVGTIFPFWVAGTHGRTGYVELPYTLPQDFTLFVLLKEKNIEVWKRKIDWIAECGGMVLVNTHPDYMHFGGKRSGADEYPATYYEDLLDYLKTRHEGAYWHPLPKEMARFWRSNYESARQESQGLKFSGSACCHSLIAPFYGDVIAPREVSDKAR